VILSIFWLGLLTSRLFTGVASPLLADRAASDVYLLFVLLGIVAYLIFPTRIAAQASLDSFSRRPSSPEPGLLWLC